MKKSIISTLLCYTMFIMGACSTEPKAGEDVNVAVDPQSEAAQNFIKAFNAKGYVTDVDDKITMNDEGVLSEGSFDYGILHSFDGEQFITKKVTPVISATTYSGFTMKDKELYGHRYNSVPSDEEIANATTPEQQKALNEKYTQIDNINWELKTDYPDAESYKNAEIIGTVK